MFSKLEQRSWIKIEVARGRSTKECFQGPCEACGDAALPYRSVTRSVKAFREGRDAVKDNLRTGRPHMNNTVQLLASCWMLIVDGLLLSKQWKSEYVRNLQSMRNNLRQNFQETENVFILSLSIMMLTALVLPLLHFCERGSGGLFVPLWRDH